MADKEKVLFSRGSSSTIPTTKVPGTFLIATDTGEMYLDDSSTLRIQIKDTTKMSISNPTGTGSFSLNRKAGTTIGDYSFAEGSNTTASGSKSHAEGYNTKAASDSQHVQGKFNIVDSDGVYADIIGNGSPPPPPGREIWVINDNAAGEFATTQISFTSNGQKFTSIGAVNDGFYVILHYDNNEIAGFELGLSYGFEFVDEAYRTITFDTPPTGALLTWLQSNATKQTSSNLSNAATVDWSGNAWYAGDVYVGSTSGTNKDAGSKKLATEEYVNSAVISGISGAVIDDGYIG